MKANLTELVYILDMSGSMQAFTDDTIGGYNTMIAEQKKQDGEAFVTTVFFDDRYIVHHDRVNLKKVKKLTRADYQPLGMTAMLDAVARTIISVGQKLDAMPEDEKPSKVMVTIVTDGYENASKEFNWQRVQDMIKEQREKYSWVFTFIGANIDVMEVSQNLGIDSRLAKSYGYSAQGVNSVYRSMSMATSKMRSKASLDAVAFDAVIDEADEILEKNIEK